MKSTITQEEKEELAWMYYVEHLTTTEIREQAHLGSNASYSAIRELRGAFRDAILEDYQKREEQLQMALKDRRNGETWAYITKQYHFLYGSAEQKRIAELAQTGEEGVIEEPPQFSEAELSMDKLYVVSKKELVHSDRKPIFGIYNCQSGRWAARGESIKIVLFETKKAANRFLKPYHPTAILQVRIYGWIRPNEAWR